MMDHVYPVHISTAEGMLFVRDGAIDEDRIHEEFASVLDRFARDNRSAWIASTQTLVASNASLVRLSGTLRARNVSRTNWTREDKGHAFFLAPAGWTYIVGSGAYSRREAASDA